MPEVLYVEDDDNLREVFVEALQNAGFSVRARKLAEEILDELARRTPDVILLDLGMPPGEMSGIELLARVRQHPRWARIPVIVLSGFADIVNPDLLERLRVRHVFTKALIRATEVAAAIMEVIESQAEPGPASE
jgi:CheY-like chemotaxis protein